MHQQHTATEAGGARVGLVLVGFSEPKRLAAIARRLKWPGRVLGDQPKVLYSRLGIGRAPLWRVYTPATLRLYASALWRRERLVRPEQEDTRQLGGDAVLIDGVIVRLWRPRSPDDRPPAAEVLAAATQLADNQHRHQ